MSNILNLSQILTSPFEGFKLETYFFNFAEYSNYLYSKEFFNIDNSADSSFFSLATQGTLLITFYILVLNILSYVNSKVFSNLTLIFQVIFAIIVANIFTFFGTSLIMEYLTLSKNGDTLVYNYDAAFFINWEISFIKDIWGFITIFAAMRLLTSFSLSNITLIPNGVLDKLSDNIYKFSLNLFSGTLDLVKEKEVQHFQEFFLKINGLFLFILGANLVGMLPYSTTITSSLMNTFFIALAIFANILITMVSEKGIYHLLELFLPSGTPMGLIPLLVPLELLSYSFRLISLSVRLFANMLAGHTLMKVFSGFSWSLLLLGDTGILLHYLPVVVLFMLTVLELGVACIQAYVFVVLSYLYVRDIFVGH